MATTAAAPKSFHIRSISLSSKFHPNLVQVQEYLHLLKSWEAFRLKKAQLSTGLAHLKELYSSVNAFLQLPLTQKALSGKERLVKELMDDFLYLLDACGIVKESLLQMREQFQSIGSMIHQGDSGLKSGLAAYHCTRKGMKKEMYKCFRLLKSMEKHVLSSDDNLFDQVFSDVLSIFSLLSSIILGRKDGKTIFSRLRSLGSKNHEDEGDQDDMSEIEKADVTIFRLCSREDNAQDGQRQVKALVFALSATEVELEDIFRCFFQTKVSLLNIVTGC